MGELKTFWRKSKFKFFLYQSFRSTSLKEESQEQKTGLDNFREMKILKNKMILVLRKIIV